MSTVTRSPFAFEHTFARDLEGLYVPWRAAPSPDPRIVVLNDEVARELGVDPAELRTPAGAAFLAGDVPDDVPTIAQAYAGHQFGAYSPRLGDGRALLLGEVVDVHGRRRDLHLKGSGRTPFARGGDGRAAIGPMLREHVVGEAMHALGVPTSRALAVVTTGERVLRESGPLPGAILARVASSHLRVGSFEYAARLQDRTVLRRLADHAIARHHPAAADADDGRYLGLFRAVLDAQASLVARWMHVGFVHGVMNTDNLAISGETIDYGPCAFVDAYDRATVFSSIDHGGRYAFGNQPMLAQWGLARLAEALVPLIDEDRDAAVAAATEALNAFPARFDAHWRRGMHAKIGLGRAPADEALVDDLVDLLERARVDLTMAFRALGHAATGDDAQLRVLFADAAPLDAWIVRWRTALDDEGRDRREVAAGMDAVNPAYIPRNHLVEEALSAATGGDLGPLERLMDAVTRPFEERRGLEAYALPGPDDADRYVTYCGT
ncbi:MAG: YdiU family protein [Solirubrobacteraceae bacterium]|nr:YdiU family protein [Solirubrobacteraceae bacterium]